MKARIARTFGLVSITLALTACASGSIHQRPDVPLPGKWQSGTAGAGEAIQGPWWRSFQNAELDRLIASAVDGNRDLKAASSRIAQARALAQGAGADRLPSLGASAGVARDKSSGKSRVTQHTAGLGASFELDLWGKNQQSHEAALGRLQSSEHARDAVTLALQAEVALTYFQLLSAQDRTAMGQSALQNAESVLRLLHVQHEAGAVSKLEVVRQQGLVASVKADLAPIELQRLQARDALAVLLGRAPQDMGLAKAPLTTVRLPTIDAGVPSSLLTRRPDIAQAEADLIAANADINAARAALFPSIKLTAAGGGESASLTQLLRPASLVYHLAAGLTAPIFDGGRLRSQVALSRARQDELVQTYHQTILRALQDVEGSLGAVTQWGEQAKHQAEVVAHATDAHQMADLRYRNGAVDFATVLDAQRVLLAAQSAQATIALSRYAAAINLHRALGGPWAVPPSTVSMVANQGQR